MRRWLLAILLFAVCAGCSRTPPPQPALPYVVLVSLDGFRHDYVDLYGAPNLKRFGDEGVHAKGLIPAYPSSTFPNHYSMITGLYPEHHGIVNNIFFDPQRNAGFHYSDPATGGDGSWYGGTPLWMLAEQQGVRAASFYWPGSDVEIRGVRPSQFRPYDESIPNADRVQQVIDWLELPDPLRPHLITVYFSDVDTAGHRYGPSAPETERAVADLDTLIGGLLRRLAATELPIDVLILSDHGMLEVRQAVSIGNAADFNGFEIAPQNGSQIMLYSADQKRVNEIAERLKTRDARYSAYLRKQTPEHLHYRENWRIGDIVVIATAPVNLYVARPGVVPEQERGNHGYDPQQFPEMRGIFYARGPDLKPGVTLEAFENVNVYRLVARLLRLKPPAGLDGSDELLSILKEN